LQFYDEGLDSTYESYKNNEIDLFVERLVLFREGRLPELTELAQKSVSFKRLHFLKQPITKYLEYEYYTYLISSSLGEQIVVNNIDVVISKDNIGDFLLFDDKCAFIHDYDSNGIYKGAWVLQEDKKDLIKEMCDWYDLQFSVATDFKGLFKPDQSIVDRILL